MVAACKTVGSAYVGSNPTPATTCENSPPAAETRPAGRFLLVMPCVAMRHRESMRCGVHGRITDGVRAARTVGVHRRLFADGPCGRAFPGLTCTAEPGGVSPMSARLFPRATRLRRCADGWGGGSGERDSCQAGRAGAGGPRIHSRGDRPRAPCGADAALLVSCSATEQVGGSRRDRHGHGQSRGTALSGWRSPTAAAPGGGRGLQLVAGMRRGGAGAVAGGR